MRNSIGMPLRNVDNNQALRCRRTKLAARKGIRQLRCPQQLVRRDTAAQHRRSDVDISGLFLSVNAHVIAEYVCWRIFRLGWIQGKSDQALQLGLKALIRPDRKSTRLN